MFCCHPIPPMAEKPGDPLDIGKRLRRGDVRALEDLLRSHAPSVLGRLARRFKGVLTREDLEEVVSGALNAIWHARDRFDSRRGSVLDWFYHISVHLAVDLTRRKQRERSLAVECHVLDAIASAPAGDDRAAPADANGRVSLFDEVRAIIDSLPPAQRAIILADIKHYPGVAPSKLFGADLDIDPGSVPVYRDRAHKKIRSELIRRGYRFDGSEG
jgi:RNA polymerase sigma factor (sigma-70 family)